jgi:3-methyladenine DNA glycosylase/8-oxoguanine DNA glycosylase
MEEKFQEYMEKTREYWSLKEKSLFHNLISLITSQKIKFSQSREIRKKLYLLNNGADEYCPKIFSNITLTEFKNCGLEPDIINVIISVIKLEDNLNLDTIKNIKGIGPWTMKALRIMNYSSNEFLYEDYWIRQRLSEILSNSKILTQSECKKFIGQIKLNNLGEISKFLWRINRKGTKKFVLNEDLSRDDFL